MKPLLTLSLCAVLVASSAAADKREDDVQGLYHGAFTGDAWQDRTIEARVMARSDTTWDAALYVGEAGADPARVIVPGSRPEDAETADFEGPVDLPRTLGGTFDVTAEVAERTMTGAFHRNGERIPFTLEMVFIEPPTLNAPCPEDGILLFDGSNLDQWVRVPEKWCLTADGAMEVCNSSLRTVEEFGSALIHLEFRTPLMPNARGQGRGNSGVYVAGIYEIQILDSFGEPATWDYCGSIYRIAAPLVNATLPPLQWQTYDIEFHAAQFDENGEKTANARMTVVHNGVLIHDDLELPDRTPGGMGGGEVARGPIYLQNHGDRVGFRNIWVLPIED